jgi:Flp pilus assembly protein TadG
LTVLTLTLLVGMVAIAVDGGSLLEDRRHVQAAADAAALAAAADLYAHYPVNAGADPSGTAAKSALDTAAANGFGNDGANSVVTVTVSPGNYQEGPNAGKPLPPGHAEVIVQLNETRKFSNVFAPGTIPVRARAVARGTWKPVPDTVHALSLHSSGAVSVGGFASIDANGSLRVNSDSVTAVVVGLGGTLKAVTVFLNSLLSGVLNLLLGLLGLGGSAHYVPPIPDPLRYLPPPDPVEFNLTNRGTNVSINSGTVDLYPGVYTGGISVGNSANVTLHTNADGSPGIYLIKGGGLNVSGSATVSTAPGEPGGIMIFNAWSAASDAITITSQSNVVLSPPSSGPYKGLTIFQARGTPTSPAPTITLAGQAGTNITGTIYGAYAPCKAAGQSRGCVLGGQHLVHTLSVSGGATVNVDASGKPVANGRQVGLVE